MTPKQIVHPTERENGLILENQTVFKNDKNFFKNDRKKALYIRFWVQIILGKKKCFFGY